MLRFEGDNATAIPLTALAVLTDVALCPPLAARVAAGTRATTSASNSARSGTPDRRKGAVRTGRWPMEALFGRKRSDGRNAEAGDHHSQGGPRHALATGWRR